MKTEKELEKGWHELAKHMPLMPDYKDYLVSDQQCYWLIYVGLFETRYLMGKSFDKKRNKYGYH